jgi:hypothetical protein
LKKRTRASFAPALQESTVAKGDYLHFYDGSEGEPTGFEFIAIAQDPTVLPKARRGSEQYQQMKSSIAKPYVRFQAGDPRFWSTEALE